VFTRFEASGGLLFDTQTDSPEFTVDNEFFKIYGLPLHDATVVGVGVGVLVAGIGVSVGVGVGVAVGGTTVGVGVTNEDSQSLQLK
jgi:hypothetical protein